MPSPAEFIRQVKQEGNKVTWPSRRETLTAALMILIVVVLFSGFFFVVDYGMSSVVDCGLHYDNIENGGLSYNDKGDYIGHCGFLGELINKPGAQAPQLPQTGK